MGRFTKKSLLPAAISPFPILPNMKASFQPCIIEKAQHFRVRLFVVAGSGEISNFECVKDLAKVVDYLSNEIGDEFLLKY